MLWIVFRFGQNGWKILYQYMNQKGKPPYSTFNEISAYFGPFQSVPTKIKD